MSIVKLNTVSPATSSEGGSGVGTFIGLCLLGLAIWGIADYYSKSKKEQPAEEAA